MQSQFLNVNGEQYQLVRKFNTGGWFDKVVEQFGGEEVCRQYHCDKLLKDSNGVFYLVNEVKDAMMVMPVETELEINNEI